MHTFDKEMVEWISEKRKNLGISQEYFSQLVNLDQTTISKIEQEKRRLNLFETMSFLTALGMTSTEATDLIRRMWDKCYEQSN